MRKHSWLVGIVVLSFALGLGSARTVWDFAFDGAMVVGMEDSDAYVGNRGLAVAHSLVVASSEQDASVIGLTVLPELNRAVINSGRTSESAQALDLELLVGETSLVITKEGLLLFRGPQEAALSAESMIRLEERLAQGYSLVRLPLLNLDDYESFQPAIR